MSQENVVAVEDAYKAFSRDGLDGFLEHWTDDLDHRSIEGAPDDRGPICGKRAMRAFIQDWIDTFDAFRMAPVELIDAEGAVVVAVLSYGGRARQSGIEIDGTFGVVFTIRNGVIARGREYATRDQALEAAGLSEQTPSGRNPSAAGSEQQRDALRPMPQENEEIVRDAWNAYSRGDYDHFEGIHDPNIVVVTLEDGTLHGSDDVLANYRRWNEAWESAETTLEEVVGHGDHVLVTIRFRGRGRSSGVEVETSFHEVYTLRDGKVLRIHEYEHRADALAAVGLTE